MEWVVVILIYIAIGLGCKLQMNERNMPKVRSVIISVAWPLALGLVIGHYATPAIEENYRRAGREFR